MLYSTVTYHKHKPDTTRQTLSLHHHLDATEVDIHQGVSPLGNIQASTNGTQEVGQTLDLSLVRHTLVVDQLLNTLVHNTLRQHA